MTRPAPDLSCKRCGRPGAVMSIGRYQREGMLHTHYLQLCADCLALLSRKPPRHVTRRRPDAT